MTVLDYLISKMPETHIILSSERADLASIPADSNCGADCVAAIDAAASYAALIRKAHGPFAPKHVAPIAQSVKDLCLLYICG